MATKTATRPKTKPAAGKTAKPLRGPVAFSEERVREKTGKGWDYWYGILDKFDVRSKGHTATAKYLRDKRKVDPWWAQAITVRYERVRGLRSD
jgi:hypothetical protein